MYLDPMSRDNPLSILQMTRGRLKDAIEAIPDDISMMSEKELRKEFSPTNVDYCLRVSFWREYEAAVKENREYVITRSILLSICSDAYFYQKFIKDVYRLAWLVKPVQSYMKEIEAVLLRGTERLWELMDIDINVKGRNGDTFVCPRLSAVLLETIKMVEARAKGHAMLRSEMRAFSVNVNDPRGLPSKTDHQTLQARMKELASRLHGVDVVGSDVEFAEGEIIEGN